MNIISLIKKIFNIFQKRWSCEGGYHQVLKIAFPLIISTASWSVQHFVDRMFLTWYSPSTIAASMPAGMLSFTIMSLFIGTVGYINTFVAQYFGANQMKKIGPVIWQGLYISIIGGIILFMIAPFSKYIFHIIGHEANIQLNEIIYFKIMCMGGLGFIGSSALAGFYTGRGKTWTIMWINVFGTIVNLIFDYLLIFGIWIFPELGMKGAAIATIISGFFNFFLYIILISKKKYNDEFHTLKGYKLNTKLLSRIIKFGLPNGIQFFIDISGFTIFILIMGRLGTVKLAASNIAFNINTLAFMPMIGTGIAISVLVGQYLGKNKPGIAQKCVYSGFHITFFYMSLIAILYILTPYMFIKPFAKYADPKYFTEMKDIIVVLLKFVAVYSIFDTFNIIFASAIKGAGDTKYVMKVIIIVSLFLLVIPTYTALIILKKGIYTGWIIASIYIITLGIIFFLRFLKGKWKSMRVIEKQTHAIPSNFPEAPSKEYEI